MRAYRATPGPALLAQIMLGDLGPAPYHTFSFPHCPGGRSKGSGVWHRRGRARHEGRCNGAPEASALTPAQAETVTGNYPSADMAPALTTCRVLAKCSSEAPQSQLQVRNLRPGEGRGPGLQSRCAVSSVSTDCPALAVVEGRLGAPDGLSSAAPVNQGQA